MIERPGFLVVGPYRLLHAGEDDTDIRVLWLGLGPDVVGPVRGRSVLAGLLEPGMLVGGVVDDEVGEHADATFAGLAHEGDEVAERAQAWIDAVKIGDVVAVIAARRR